MLQTKLAYVILRSGGMLCFRMGIIVLVPAGFVVAVGCAGGGSSRKNSLASEVVQVLACEPAQSLRMEPCLPAAMVSVGVVIAAMWWTYGVVVASATWARNGRVRKRVALLVL